VFSGKMKIEPSFPGVNQCSMASRLDAQTSTVHGIVKTQTEKSQSERVVWGVQETVRNREKERERERNMFVVRE